MDIVNIDIINYLNNVQPMCTDTLGEIQKDAYEKGIPIIPNETAKMISVLLSIIKPEKILEIGCAVGFSSSLMSKYIKESGSITTIDRFPVMIEQAKANFLRLGVLDKVKLLEGDAADILPTLSEKFDVIFMDAAKGQYIKILPKCLKLLKTGGVIIADDVMQNGNVAVDLNEIPRRQRTIYKRMKKFLYTISNTEGLISCIIPIGGGVAITYKEKDVINIEEIEHEEI